jgi:hypothetical protein
MTGITPKEAAAIDKIFADAFTGMDSAKAPTAGFKPSFKSVAATVKTFQEAVATRNVDLVLSCMTPKAIEKARKDLGEGLGTEIGSEDLKAVIGMFMLPMLDGYKLGKQLSSSDTKRVYEYSTNVGPGETPQTFEKVGSKWLMAD